MARTKQTARKLSLKRTTISRQSNTGKQKKKDKKAVLQARRTKATVKAKKDCEEIVLAGSDSTNSTRVRVPYDLTADLGTHVLFIFLGPHPTGPQFQITSVHTYLLPAQTYAVLEAGSHQPYENIPQRLYFLDTEPETFELYRRYLYSEAKSLQSKHGNWDQDFADDGDSEAHENREWVRLAHAYLLGKKLHDEEICNVAVDGLVEKMAETDRSPTGLAADVYAGTEPGDKLRSLIVDLHVWKGLGTWLTPPHNDASGPRAFIQDVNQGILTAGNAINDPDIPMPCETELRNYHSHDVTTKCERPASVISSDNNSYVGHTTGVSQRLMADWFVKRSSGENVLDEDGDTIVVASPPKTPRRSPRTAAVAREASKQRGPSTPKRR